MHMRKRREDDNVMQFGNLFAQVKENKKTEEVRFCNCIFDSFEIIFYSTKLFSVFCLKAIYRFFDLKTCERLPFMFLNFVLI